MYKGIKGKIYPNKAQQRLINQTFGHSRFVWNQMLAMLNTRYDNNPHVRCLSYNALSILLTQLKKEHPWLKERWTPKRYKILSKRSKARFDSMLTNGMLSYLNWAG